jgi:nondiscriminating glutamyl-tRNA synthetase
MPFRTRQAPSPTGFLHLGTARTVLFTHLISRINNGTWYLRVEDTDRNRLQQEAVRNLLETLEKLGLDNDEGVTLKRKGSYSEFYDIYQYGYCGPYIQSERLAIYHEHAQNLIDRDLAYWSYTTDQQKNELQELKSINKKSINYYQFNLDTYGENALKVDVPTALKDERKPVLRYRLKRNEIVTCYDELLGKTEFDLNLEEDFSLLKSDGYPTYHLAHLVDDFLMKTSLVIRAQEWYPSISRHVTMFKDYWGGHNQTMIESKNGKNVPAYLHLPFILGETGNKKMSKRDGNVNMADYLSDGYLPEAIVNYLAFLGWNPGTEKEIYLTQLDFDKLSQRERLGELIHNLSLDFSVETLSKSPARFSLQKLQWFNREYIKMMKLDEFQNVVCGFNSEYGKPEDLDTQFTLSLLLDQNRITTVNELGLESGCIWSWKPATDEDLKWKKITLEETKDNVKEIAAFVLSKYDDFDSLQTELYSVAEDRGDVRETFDRAVSWWEETLKTWLTENDKQTGDYLWPLRVALSGKKRSPSPFEILSILKKDEVESRLGV